MARSLFRIMLPAIAAGFVRLHRRCSRIACFGVLASSTLADT